jgi:hypothetical protein
MVAAKTQRHKEKLRFLSLYLIFIYKKANLVSSWQKQQNKTDYN